MKDWSERGYSSQEHLDHVNMVLGHHPKSGCTPQDCDKYGQEPEHCGDTCSLYPEMMTHDNTMNAPSVKTLQRYADTAMFKAEPMEKSAQGVQPRVYLLGMTADPLGHIAAACKMYKGEVVRELNDVTDAERREYFEQVQRTHLQAPFEFVDFHFLLEGVTRSFTHQLVRQRTAVYAQESLRFAVKEDASEAVALPPSLVGTAGPEEHLPGIHSDPQQSMRDQWELAVRDVSDAYNLLVNLGMPAEDARGLLPHNITTRVHYKTNLRNLLEHAGNRLCTQAQFEWRAVWMQIVQAIANHVPREPTVLTANADECWQQEVLSEIFRPICYLTGKCEFKANFDRACSIRGRVDANAKIGRPSEQWNEDYGATVVGPIIPAIHTREWLADPTAARVR